MDSCDEKPIRAFLLTAHGVMAYYAARSPGEANTRLARILVEHGYNRTMGDAYKAIQCKRAPEKDAEAEALGRPDCLGEVEE